MEKEEVLARSRAENKDKDLFELEVLSLAHRVSLITMVFFAGVLFCVEIFLGNGINWGIYALLLAGNAAMFWVKWARLHRRHELALAIATTVMAAAMTAAHIYNLTAI